MLALILKTNSEKEKQRETYNRNGDNQEWCEWRIGPGGCDIILEKGFRQRVDLVFDRREIFSEQGFCRRNQRDEMDWG